MIAKGFVRKNPWKQLPAGEAAPEGRRTDKVLCAVHGI